jgi:hypothetical protein
MEEPITNPENQAIICPVCNADATANDAFCPGCRYPFKGTEHEQRVFGSNRNVKEIDLDETNKKIRQASITLFFVAGTTIVLGLALYAVDKDPSTQNSLLISNGILAVIYAGLGFGCKKRPLASIISGLSLYILVIIFNVIVSPLSIFSGIIFKIIFIGLFVKGIKSALEAEKIKKELNIS